MSIHSATRKGQLSAAFTDKSVTFGFSFMLNPSQTPETDSGQARCTEQCAECFCALKADDSHGCPNRDSFNANISSFFNKTAAADLT